MANEEAIKQIEAFRTCMIVDDAEPYVVEALNMAVEALEREPCEDVIRRQAVMNLIRGLTRWCVRSEDGRFNNVGLLYDDVMFGLDKLPPVTPQPKMGRWLIKDGREQGYDIAGVKTWYIQILCSECGFIKTAIEGHTGQYHYCPNCGAKMREVKDDKRRSKSKMDMLSHV